MIVQPTQISFDFYEALVDAGITTFDTTTPKNIDKTVKDFVVYEIGFVKPMHDFDDGSAARSYITLKCFTKNKSNSIVNTAAMDKLISKVRDAVSKITSYRVVLSSFQSSVASIEDYSGYGIIYNIFKI